MRTILRDNYTPEMGAYHETLVIDETRHKKYLFDCDGVFTDITNPLVVSERGDSEDFAASQKWVTDIDDKVDGLAEDLGDEIQARTDADDAIWAEIEEIEMSSDVVDIVGTYAELQQYDTSKLHDNDIIKVLRDETHQNETAYYRWSTATDTFSYVGSEGPYYTESEVDALLADKQDTLIAGNNIQIAADGKTISATDTTYTHFTGATASTDGEQGLVPGPLAGDEGKFLQGDGTWGTPTDTTYTAGTNVQISNQNVISATDTTYSAGANVQISSENVISATDTTYSNFVGTDGQTAGTAGLVPAPTTADVDKVLRGDGTWGDAGTTTVFYIADTIQPTAIYRENTLTTAVSAQDLIDAIDAGGVVLKSIADNCYLTLEGYYNQTNNLTFFFTYNGSGNYLFTYASASTTIPTFSTVYLQEHLTAGSNISISGATISATDTTYTAGTGIAISAQNVISASPNNISSNDWSALWQ